MTKKGARHSLGTTDAVEYAAQVEAAAAAAAAGAAAAAEASGARTTSSLGSGDWLAGAGTTGEPEQVHVALTGFPHALRVMWVTFGGAGAGAEAAWGTAPGVLAATARANASTYDVGILGGWHGTIHTVDMVFPSHLPPRTTVYYAVSGTCPTACWSPVFSVALPAAIGMETATTLALWGDMGTVIPDGWRVAADVAAAARRADGAWNAMHIVGDLAYAGMGAHDAWQPIWDMFGRQMQDAAVQVPLMVSVGNHEEYYDFEAYVKRFSAPGAVLTPGANRHFWYSYEVGNIHVTSMSTEHPYLPGTPQYAWLAADLKAVDRRRTPWLVLVSHRPFLASDAFEHTAHIPGAPLVDSVGRLAAAAGVDLVVSGHCHVYERTLPTLPSGAVTSHGAANGTVFHAPGAPIWIVAGTGGAIYPDSWVVPIPPWSAVRIHKLGDDIVYGYGVVSTNATALEWTLHRAAHSSYPGGPSHILDRFTLIR
ncbi:purple acid phosphatase 18 [Thecamonas trahens ATCC 50062]|uniref:Purple acid phosphatase n=1 Tax=Thecamonas trahens ATCC 50062 TaxID=461836 RepID=A0A0L0DJ10_THETB|nr:purple acid phosphatase 18 [Thecamonas trahens ATCC 50062]KNC52389.1 purple acid phosphatase 18 [Thecamonas trahens ATCC 50062]|eukprot:XP_013755433.1 purple acid phosphatase 18 [Thecamonas trahens ATCC 50062]